MHSSFIKYVFCFFISMAFFLKPAFAQRIDRTVYSNSGKYISNSALAISYTIGEPVIFTGTGSNIISTQGFEQPDQITITFGNSSYSLMDIKAYPNPVSDQLYVHINSNISISDFQLQVFDIYGKKIKVDYNYASALLDHTFLLNLSFCEAGIYFIKITSEIDHLNDTFKIIKE